MRKNIVDKSPHSQTALTIGFFSVFAKNIQLEIFLCAGNAAGKMRILSSFSVAFFSDSKNEIPLKHVQNTLVH
jgi:hypothetical protein